MVTSLGTVILSNLMPKMYPILQRFPDIAMAYYKSLNCFLELLVCNNEVRIECEVPSGGSDFLSLTFSSTTFPSISSITSCTPSKSV